MKASSGRGISVRPSPRSGSASAPSMSRATSAAACPSWPSRRTARPSAHAALREVSLLAAFSNLGWRSSTHMCNHGSTDGHVGTTLNQIGIMRLWQATVCASGESSGRWQGPTMRLMIIRKSVPQSAMRFAVSSHEPEATLDGTRSGGCPCRSSVGARSRVPCVRACPRRPAFRVSP